MTGQTLKIRLIKHYRNLADVARTLGVSPQSLNQSLAVADIKTGFIEKLANVYGVSPAVFFEDESDSASVKISKLDAKISRAKFIEGNNNQLNAEGAYGNINGCDAENVSLLKDLLAEKDARISELKERIEELKSKCN